MRTEVNLNNYAEFRERFSFHDGIVESISYDYLLDYSLDNRDSTITIKLTVHERSTEWILASLILEFENVLKIVLKHKRKVQFDAIYKFQMTFANEAVYVNFFPHLGEEKELDAYEEVSTVGLQLIIVAKQCFWTSMPYADNQTERK